jgi:hypothetical protein
VTTNLSNFAESIFIFGIVVVSAALCEKIVENVIVAKNRVLTTNQYNQRDCCSAAAPYNHRNFLSFHGGKKLLPKYHCGFVSRRNIYCNGLSCSVVDYHFPRLIIA